MAVIRVTSHSAQGLTAAENQDALRAVIPRSPAELADRGALFLVADGLGGHQGGAVASRIAADAVCRHYYGDRSPITIGQRLTAAIGSANGWVRYWARQRADLREMGTTLTAVVVVGESLLVAHVGDSRAYLVRAGRAWRLTQDETWCAGAMRRGLLTPEEAAHHPWRNILERYLGGRSALSVQVQRYVIHPGDMLLLSSDGVTDWIRGDELAAMVSQAPWNESAPRAMATLARRRGSNDDASVLVVSLDHQCNRAKPVSGPVYCGAGTSFTGSLEVAFAVSAGALVGFCELCLMLLSL